jgi:hypothetical protein
MNGVSLPSPRGRRLVAPTPRKGGIERGGKEAVGLNRKLKMGMVGGGRDAFIGAVHRSAALMDGKVEFTAGALSSNPEKA